MPYPAPLLLTNGVIHTMSTTPEPVTALALDRATGYILAVGQEREVRASLGTFARMDVVDLHGRVVIPGLLDAHTHILAAARDTIEVNLAGCTGVAAAVALVAAQATSIPLDTWIIGRHWNQNAWPGGQFPTRAALDAVVPDHPCLLWTHSQHAVWVNSLALTRAGISRETADPPGGVIERDADGEPTGMLFEGAATLVDAVCEAENDVGAQIQTALRHVLHDFAARGLTGVYTMEGERSLRLMQHLRGAGELPLRVGYYVPVGQLAALQELGIEAGFGDDWLRICGVKIFADGALGTRTAAMLQPYTDVPDNVGLLTTSAEQMAAQVGMALRGGLGVAIHAIGDRAVRAALDSIESALAQASLGLAPRRCRLEHVQLAELADIARMARLGVVGSVQPFHAVSDRDVAERAWGERAAQAYPYATLVAHGVRLALGSDVPIEMADPRRIMHAAIARTDDAAARPAWHPEQALTPQQALWAYTAGAAWAGGDEARLGQLAPGYLGDCVILAADPLRIPVADLPTLPVEATLVGGQVVAGKLE